MSKKRISISLNENVIETLEKVAEAYGLRPATAASWILEEVLKAKSFRKDNVMQLTNVSSIMEADKYERLIRDAEWRIGSYVATHNIEIQDQYISRQIDRIKKYYNAWENEALRPSNHNNPT
jgi:predicted nucleotidyltransferase